VSLKQVNPNNPFIVPEGYFDSLSETILSKITLEEAAGNKQETGFTVPENYFTELGEQINAQIRIASATNKEAPGFTVPDGYFNELTDQITARITIEEALNKEDTSFAVPYGYFDELSANITARINIEQSADKDQPGFAVPADYFENLQQQIQSRIKVEEALSIPSGALTVPENYFDRLTENILAKTVKQEKKETGGAIIRKFIATSAVKYATAACLVIAIGGTLFLNRSADPDAVHKDSFLHKSLASIPVDDIQNYLQLHLDGNDTRTLMDETKPADAENLNIDLQQALDSASQ